MKKLLKKKVNVFGKGVPVLAIFVLGLALVSAALIPLWGTITGLVTVNQGFQVGGVNWNGDQADWFAEITSLEEGKLSSEDYSLINSAEVGAEIKFITTCTDNVAEEYDGCNDVITTEMVELSVIGFPSGVDPFGEDEYLYYRATNYVGPESLDDLDTVTYSFKITENTFADDRFAPYLVISSPEMPYGAIVYLLPVPGGPSYTIGETYTVTLDSADLDTLFHVPGDTYGCAGQNPETSCTLNEIKSYYSSATITRVRVALGAWGDETKTITALAGIDTINEEQAVHKSFIVGANDESSLKIVTDFPKMMKPDVYTFTTDVLPVTA